MNESEWYRHNPAGGWNKKVCKKCIFYYITSKYTIKNIPLRGYVSTITSFSTSVYDFPHRLQTSSSTSNEKIRINSTRVYKIPL